MSILGVNYKRKLKMEGKEGLHALFDYATEGILITNSAGKIVKINRSAEKMFGYCSGELFGQKIEILVPQRISKAHEKHREGFQKNPHARSMGAGIELLGKRKDNTEFPVEISLSPYTTTNNRRYVIAFIIDITGRKKAEEKLKTYSQELEKEVQNRTLILREAIAELEQTKEKLSDSLKKERELNELKSRFVSMASHEFRTPLTTILSSLSLVDKYTGKIDEDKRLKHINRIKSSIINMTEILNDFLSIGKLEEGQIYSSFITFDISLLAREVTQELQVVAKPDQKIIYRHSGNSVDVYLDKKLVKNILINLLSNAIKFSHEKQQIDLTTEIKGKLITIKVKDRGIGIHKNDQKHLFERFFRGHNVTNIQGTGLGLNILKKYVELMNGTINFKSKISNGTTFIIKFSNP